MAVPGGSPCGQVNSPRESERCSRFFVFKENQYVLVIAAEDARAAQSNLNVQVLDLVGIPVPSHIGAGEGRIAVAVRPELTGTCYLSLLLSKDSPSMKLAVGYAVK